MLVRVAETLYWMARYLERAENMARLINVNTNLILDIPKKTELGWEPLIDITGTREMYEKYYDNFDERSVMKYLISDADSPVSIANSLKWARDNGRTVRDVIPREAWEQINALNHYAKDQLNVAMSKRGRFSYLNEIILRNQTIVGLLSGTVNRDQGYVFVRLGRNIERADMTSRIIDVRSANLLTLENVDMQPFENIQWMSVLKSLTAYQMYRQAMQARVRRSDVVKFLFQSQRFPRSILFCVQQMERCVNELPERDNSMRRIHHLLRILKNAELHAYDQSMLHVFIDQIQIELSSIHDALMNQFFLSGRVQQSSSQTQKQAS
ncbi:alpha-E domain-containing protein [Ketobacter sp. MCCC 1A13808]|uniref:alpha-E domain-containing protein n=1 Tax=Ketobacter sp. MCCC 1A13808 TaxID=2602738 RepID=UPI000F1FB644|nr:alpha-E domain-containing protein [Ketobacter sp. MCCC 1A13808]MVF11916.1 alpha-E domain-containing protein [Ketobacter sp. MCCC 1A13808]RLP53097.1 MAG: alpha-E domain-containing protein [Ketobacter sp.]